MDGTFKYFVNSKKVQYRGEGSFACELEIIDTGEKSGNVKTSNRMWEFEFPSRKDKLTWKTKIRQISEMNYSPMKKRYVTKTIDNIIFKIDDKVKAKIILKTHGKMIIFVRITSKINIMIF